MQRCEDIVATFARLHSAQNGSDVYFEDDRLSAIDPAWRLSQRAHSASAATALRDVGCLASAIHLGAEEDIGAERGRALRATRPRYAQHLRLPVVVA